MSDIMLYGILRMPFEMAMHGELSRGQFYQAAQEAADRLQKAEEQLMNIGSAEYEGNSVSHWHDHAVAYGDCIVDCWKVLQAKGWRPFSHTLTLQEALKIAVDMAPIPAIDKPIDIAPDFVNAVHDLGVEP